MFIELWKMCIEKLLYFNYEQFLLWKGTLASYKTELYLHCGFKITLHILGGLASRKTWFNPLFHFEMPVPSQDHNQFSGWHLNLSVYWFFFILVQSPSSLQIWYILIKNLYKIKVITKLPNTKGYLRRGKNQ
jgi:hypothetical protein